MAIRIKSLGQDDDMPLNDYDVIVESPGTAKAVIVKSIRIVNASTTWVQVNLVLKHSTEGPSLNIIPKDYVIPYGGSIIDDSEITLGPADQILGKASQAGVYCVVSGVERDQI